MRWFTGIVVVLAALVAAGSVVMATRITSSDPAALNSTDTVSVLAVMEWDEASETYSTRSFPIVKQGDGPPPLAVLKVNGTYLVRPWNTVMVSLIRKETSDE